MFEFPQDILEYEEFTLMEIGMLVVLLLGSDEQKSNWQNSAEFKAILSFLVEISVLEKTEDGGLNLNATKKSNFAILKLDDKQNPIFVHKNYPDTFITKDLVGGRVMFICDNLQFFNLQEVEQYLDSNI